MSFIVNKISLIILVLILACSINWSYTQSVKCCTENETINISKESPIVKTSSGLVKGKIQKVFGSDVYTFLGVPYAQPPIGELRFARPVPIKKWDAIKTTVNFGPMCPQKVLPRNLVPMIYISENTDEDCLTLNVWTPGIKGEKLRPVMIWIHGGVFQYNSANLYDTDGKVLSSYGDVVVVSINYRLGVLGFLSAQTESAPGNMGLYDQSLAINWVKENIEEFGGDPNKLVPFGESAGSMAIGMLMSMNSTKNLFSRAITSSGGGLLAGILTSRTEQKSEHFSKLIGCALNNEFKSEPEKVVHCLKDMPLNRLIEVQTQMLEFIQMPFTPTSNGFFNDFQLPGQQLQEETLFSNMKEMLTGIMSNEGAYLMHAADPQVFTRHTYPQLTTLDETRSLFTSFLHKRIGMTPHYVANLMSYVMITGPKKDSPENTIRRLTETFGDMFIACPTIYMANEFVARNKSVYMFLYEHRSSATKFGRWVGTSHYEDVPFVFGYPLRRTKIYSKKEINFSKRIMKFYSHFAKTGQALPQLELEWPRYNNKKSVMVLKPEESSIIENFQKATCQIFEASFTLLNHI